ncbi:MAG: AMIN domain-containing protein [Anaeromyxobacteraceae bacterium]
MSARRVLSLAALLALAAPGTARPQQLNVITAVELKDEGASTVLSVKGSRPPNFTTFSMADPPRFVIDLSESRFEGVPEDLVVQDGLVNIVKNLSYGSDATSIARVMIAFQVDVEPPEVTTAGNTLVVRVLKPAAGGVAAAPAQAAPPSQPAQPDPAAAEAARVEAERQAAAQAEAERLAAAQAAAQRQAESEQRQREEEQAKAAAAAVPDAQAQAQEPPPPPPVVEQAGQDAGAQAAAQAEAAAQAQAQADAKVAAAAAAKAEKQAKAEAAAQAKADALAKKQAEAEAKRQAKEDAKRAAAEAKQAAADAKRLAAEEKKAAAEAKKRARQEELAAARAAQSVEAEPAMPGSSERLDAGAPRATLRQVGFKELPGASRVFVRTSVTPKFTIAEAGENTIRVELENTKPTRRNDTRFMDTSFFPGAVALVSPSRHGSTYVVEIKLKQRVPYQQKIEGDMLALDFERPAGSAPAPAPGPDGAAAEPPAAAAADGAVDLSNGDPNPPADPAPAPADAPAQAPK